MMIKYMMKQIFIIKYFRTEKSLVMKKYLGQKKKIMMKNVQDETNFEDKNILQQFRIKKSLDKKIEEKYFKIKIFL